MQEQRHRHRLKYGISNDAEKTGGSRRKGKVKIDGDMERHNNDENEKLSVSTMVT